MKSNFWKFQNLKIWYCAMLLPQLLFAISKIFCIYCSLFFPSFRQIRKIFSFLSHFFWNSCLSSVRFIHKDKLNFSVLADSSSLWGIFLCNLGSPISNPKHVLLLFVNALSKYFTYVLPEFWKIKYVCLFPNAFLS